MHTTKVEVSTVYSCTSRSGTGQFAEPCRERTISLLAGILFVLIAEAMVVSWAVRQSIGNGQRIPEKWESAIDKVARFPSLMKASFVRIRAGLSSDPFPLLIDAENPSALRASEKKPDQSEQGYLLFSGVSASAKQSVVQLIRLSDDQLLWEWRPDFRRINEVQSQSKYMAIDSAISGRAMDPVVQEDGSLIFNTFSRLVRLDLCGEVRWAIAGPFHHSVEQDGNGNIWVPAVHEKSFPGNEWLNEFMRDDALGQVSVDGQVLGIYSFAQILIRNGLNAHVFGHSFNKISGDDPFHINDIQPARSDGDYWLKGDLLISARNLSTVFLFRPATAKILWYKTGPWVNQHDANFVDAHRISVFGNDVLMDAPSSHTFANESGANQVYLYDFKTDSVSTPFAQLLESNPVRSVYEGRATVGDGDSLFIEETTAGRHLRFRDGKLLWSRLNWYDQNRIGVVSWSRYLTASDVRSLLELVSATRCPAKKLASRPDRP